MWKRLKAKLKGRKGFGSIEIAICSLIILMMIGGLADMIQIMQKIDTVSQTTGYVARTIQKQGGVRTVRIQNFYGKYTTTPVLYNNVKDMMASNGIPEEDWKLYIAVGDKTYSITPSTSVPLVNYGYRMKVILKVDYRWAILSNMIPIDLKATKDSVREVLSGYQIRNGDGMGTDLSL
jgi:hypothetical protein